MTYTRKNLIRELKSMQQGTWGRRKTQRLLMELTTAELIAATGVKPRVRVKALRGRAV